MDFGSLLGNETIKARLGAAARDGTFSHSYLICGPQGSGKHTLSQILAAALLCQSDTPPCGQCIQCRKVRQQIHPDLVVVDDTEHKTIPVELIRRVCADAFIRPNEAKRKVYLIPRAQDLGLPGQNALLKLIEEPPAYAAFVLLSENPDKLLPTIRSRCVELHLAPLTSAQMLPRLQAEFADSSPEDLQAAMLRSGGWLGQARAALSGSQSLLPQTETFCQAFAARNKLAMIELLTSMEKMPRQELLTCLTQWAELLHAAMLVRNGAPAPSAAGRTLANRRTLKELMQAVQTLQQAMVWAQANVGVGHICGALAAAFC